MSEPTKAAVLPDKYRKPERPQPMTLGTLQIGETANIDQSDIKIDAQWGVWINPDAVIPAPPRPVSPSSIVVTKLDVGYALNLAGALRVLAGEMTKDPVCTSFVGLGFVPAFSVH